MDDDQDDMPMTQPVDDRVLKDVIAFVEVRSANDNRTESVRKELEQLGATVMNKFTEDVTHVVFKEGCNRTKVKALKKGIHFVSVLWVDNCKRSQEHVSERMFPAFVPKTKGPQLLYGKMKKSKSMQPRDFAEEVANSAEKVRRKRKRLETMHKLHNYDSTPPYSPRPGILVQDTQPRSPDDEFVFTPVRLTIPDTPPGMREKIKELNLLKECDGAETASDIELEAKQENLKLLQKKLFEVTSDLSDEESPIKCSPKDTKMSPYAMSSDAAVNEDILSIAEKINVSIGCHSKSKRKYFGADSDESSLNLSQEILYKTEKKITTVQSNNSPIRVKSNTEEQCDTHGKRNFPIEQDTAVQKEKKGSSGKTNPRRSTRYSLQPYTDLMTQLNKKKPDETNTHFDNSNESRESVCKATDKLENYNNDLHLQLSLSPPSQIQNLDNRNKVKEVVNKGTDPPVGKKTPPAKKLDRSIGDSEIEKKPRRRSSIRTKRNSIQASDSISFKDKDTTVCSDSDMNLLVDAANKGENPGNKVTSTVADTNDSSVEPKKQRQYKKKLLPLSGLMDQHSVLIEPSKSSEDGDRKTLIDGKQDTTIKRKGRKSVNNAKQCESTTVPELTRLNTDKEKKTCASKKTKHDKENDENCSTASGNRRKRNSVNPVVTKSKKVKKVLADDTHVEDREIVLTTKGSNNTVDPFNDLTTQLNLTKDKSLTCSIRETTLSMSMSRAYPDNDMSSIMASARRSIDDFSQKNGRKARGRNPSKTVFTSIREVNVSPNSSSDSDKSYARSDLHKKKRRPSIVMTSLHSHEQDVVISVVKKLGGFVITDNVNETTTHVICGESRRTLNILQCLARGLWLLSKEWVIKSLEADQWISEENYECIDFFPICKVTRTEREKCVDVYRPSLFTGCGLIYVSGRSAPPRPQLVQLIKLCSGKVTSQLEKASVYVGGDYHVGLTCVKTTWVLDCIKSHQSLPLERYSLDRPKRESSPVY